MPSPDTIDVMAASEAERRAERTRKTSLESNDSEDVKSEEEGNKDHDEDRRNPQYIPKRGMFYEHDDRIDSSCSEGESGVSGGIIAQENKDPLTLKTAKTKAVKVVGGAHWGHDKFSAGEQGPKSKDELVSVYGYDIRNEESAPRARRRRRYGRGPNKYTRNWEDEQAYNNSNNNSSHAATAITTNTPPSTRGRGSARGRGSITTAKEAPPSRGRGSYRGHVRGGRGGRGSADSSSKNSPKSEVSKPRATKKRDSSLEKGMSRVSINNEEPESPKASQSSTAITSKRYSSMRLSNNGTRASSEEYYENASTPATFYNRGAVPAAAVVVVPPPSSQQPPPRFIHSTYAGSGGGVNYGPQDAVAVPFPYIVPPVLPLPITFVQNKNPVPIIDPTTMQIIPQSAAEGYEASGEPSEVLPMMRYDNQAAEVHDGVTYYNPTVQAPVLVDWNPPRPKAVIPIVDPADPSAPSSC